MYQGRKGGKVGGGSCRVSRQERREGRRGLLSCIKAGKEGR